MTNSTNQTLESTNWNLTLVKVLVKVKLNAIIDAIALPPQASSLE